MEPGNNPNPQPPKIDPNQIYSTPVGPTPMSTPIVSPTSDVPTAKNTAFKLIKLVLFGGGTSIIPTILGSTSSPTGDPSQQNNNYGLIVAAKYAAGVGLPVVLIIYDLMTSAPGDAGSGVAVLGLGVIAAVCFVVITIGVVIHQFRDGP